MSDTGDFLGALWGHGFHSLCAKSPGGRFRVVDMFGDPDNLLVAAGRLGGHDTWFGLHGMAELPTGRGGGDDVTSVVALGSDLDWHHAAHRVDGLPSEVEVRARLIQLGNELAPSVVVHSGHGLQAYWLLDTDVGATAGADLQARLDTRLAEVGLCNERGDLASVLRLPGTSNMKADPVGVVIEQACYDRRYVPQYLTKRLPKARKGRSGRTARTLDERDETAVDLLLERFGGHHPRVLRSHVEICRPGKDDGCSATIGVLGPGTVKVWSSNWPPFEQGQVLGLHELRKLAGVDGPKLKTPPAATPTPSPFVRASGLTTSLQRWVWDDRIPAGELTVAAGREKLGKSTALVWVAAQLTLGKLPGFYEGTPCDVLFVSAEDHALRVLLPRLDLAGADRERLFLLDPLGSGFTVKAVRDLNAALGLIVLDPLSVFLNLPGSNEHGENATRRALMPFVELAQDFECALVGIRHFNKGSARDNPFDVVMGSRAYSAAARSVLFFTPDREHKDGPGGLIFAKGNLAADSDAMRYRLAVHDVQLDDGNVGRHPLFVDDGKATNITLEDALGPEEEATERSRVEEWLLVVLADGPVPATDIERLARDDHITETTLRRAKKNLGVVSERVGGLGADGCWMWSMPDKGGQ